MPIRFAHHSRPIGLSIGATPHARVLLIGPECVNRIGMVSSLASAAALAVLSVSLRPGDCAAPGWQVDAAHSSVTFRVMHMESSWTYGRFNLRGGGAECAGEVAGCRSLPGFCEVAVDL